MVSRERCGGENADVLRIDVARRPGRGATAATVVERAASIELPHWDRPGNSRAVVLFAAGAFRNGLFRYAGTTESGNIPVFHLVAEAAMAMTSVAGGWALRARRPYGRGAALAACGMLEYSAINSSGWLLRNRPWVVIVTGRNIDRCHCDHVVSSAPRE